MTFNFSKRHTGLEIRFFCSGLPQLIFNCKNSSNNRFMLNQACL